MKKSIYIDKEFQLAIYLNEDENICYSCDLNLDGTVNNESVGILIELDSKIIKRANRYLKTDITNYGVKEVKDEVIYKNDTQALYS